MEKRTQNSIISASFTLLIFVGLPFVLQRYIPTNFVLLLAQMGLDLQRIINQIMLIGVLAAVITLIKGFISETSILFLIISISRKILTIFIMILLLGAGNLTSLGLTTLNLEIENSKHSITLNYQLFLYITFLLVFLKVFQSYYDWSKMKKENNLRMSNADA
jgi:hypothetical protein